MNFRRKQGKGNITSHKTNGKIKPTKNFGKMTATTTKDCNKLPPPKTSCGSCSRFTCYLYDNFKSFVAENGDTALHQAVESCGDHDCVITHMINAGCNVFRVDEGGNLALHVAAEKGHVGCTELFIQHKVDVNTINIKGNTPVMIAAQHGSANVVNRLIDAGANPNVKNHLGQNALLLAVLNKHYCIASRLSQLTIDINIRDENGDSPLFVAAKRNQVKLMGMLLQNGAKLSAVDERGRNALHWAVEHGHTDACKYLIQCGIDLDLLDENNHAPFMVAIRKNKSGMLELLMESGCDITNLDGLNGTALGFCCLEDSPGCARILLERGEDPDERSYYGETPLKLAAYKAHSKMVDVLLSYDVDIQNRGKLGCDVMAKCCIDITNLPPHKIYNRHVILGTLLRCGGQPNQAAACLGLFSANASGRTSTMGFATATGITSLVEMLMIAGGRMEDEQRQVLQKPDNLAQLNSKCVYRCLDFVQKEECKPRSLKSRARIVIREALPGQRKHELLHKLPLPEILQKYLNFPEFEDILARL